MKASSAIRILTGACRISPKRTSTRILTMQRQSRNLESRNNFSFLLSPFLFSQFLLSALFFVSVLPSFAQTNYVTPAQYLQSQPKPNFAAGHHLPHLSDWSAQSFSSNTCVEIAKKWGYCLPFDFSDLSISSITNATGRLYCSLASNNPSVFKLSVITDRSFPKPIPDGFYCTNSSGVFITNADSRVISPAGPDGYWMLATSNTMFSLSVLQSNAPIAIILNGGEYGLNVVGAWFAAAWKQDPRMQAATNGIVWPGGVIERYGSLRKAHQLGFLTSSVKQAFPNRELYIFYKTDAERVRTTYPGNPTFWTGPDWGWCSDVMDTNTDLPSFENYYQGSWTGAYDLLTCQLNCVGFNLNLGYTNNYSWFSGGWQASTNLNTSLLSDIPTYTGFLKCLYTAGTIGGVAGYFYVPDVGYGTEFGGPGWDAAFPTNIPPHWLLQIMALSHVHALFSHLENVLTNGDLLSGPQAHRYSLDQPAYEFTNTAGYVNDRVLVRKLRGTNFWLVTAWAADGTNQNVTVSIPTIGALTVSAVSSGSVYQVTMAGTNVQQTLLDEYASFLPAPPVNFRVISGSTN
jgi:hypothetical protein